MTTPAAGTRNSIHWSICCVGDAMTNIVWPGMKSAAILRSLAVAVLVLVSAAPSFAADPATLARDVAEFERTAPGAAGEKALRARLAAGFGALKGRASPEAAVAHEGRAEAAVQMAKNPADFLIAAKEFEKAIQIAPWVAAYHFNRGVVLEKAEKYAEAAKSLDLYLLAEPAAKDAREVKKKIAGLRFKQELTARPAPPPAAPAKPAQPATPSLVGTWNVHTWWGGLTERPTVTGRWGNKVEGTAQVSGAGQRFHVTSRHNQNFVMVFDGIVSANRISGTAVLNAISRDTMCRGATNQFGFEGTVVDGKRIVIEVKGGVSVTFPGGREKCTFEASWRSMSILLVR